jgi:pimeloyl-ACP methyl ester carboxylesterase
MKAGTRLPGTPEPMHMWKGSDGVRLAGDTWGHPDGPLVVLLHGGGQTRHAWGGTGELLGKTGYFALAYDARGHGDSDWSPDGDYSQDALVRDLKCVVAALGGRRPVLVGASMGGGTSLVASGERHIDAHALILVDIVPYTEPTDSVRSRKSPTRSANTVRLNRARAISTVCPRTSASATTDATGGIGIPNSSPAPSICAHVTSGSRLARAT